MRTEEIIRDRENPKMWGGGGATCPHLQRGMRLRGGLPTLLDERPEGRVV
jgi:hypothetical protein